MSTGVYPKMYPHNRDSIRPHLGRKISRTFAGKTYTINLFGSTDAGVFLGELECGPYVTYKWLLENCVWADTGEAIGRHGLN